MVRTGRLSGSTILSKDLAFVLVMDAGTWHQVGKFFRLAMLVRAVLPPRDFRDLGYWDNKER